MGSKISGLFGFEIPMSIFMSIPDKRTLPLTNHMIDEEEKEDVVVESNNGS